MRSRSDATGRLRRRAALLALLIGPLPAWATLGEPETSVQRDGAALKGEVRVSAEVASAQGAAAYRESDVDLPSGTRLKEYSTPGGGVFAITWRGPSMPNLRQALGTYFDAYTAAARAAPHADRHHLEVRTQALVVEVSGHMRAFAGRAYLPRAVPAGVSVDALP